MGTAKGSWPSTARQHIAIMWTTIHVQNMVQITDARGTKSMQGQGFHPKFTHHFISLVSIKDQGIGSRFFRLDRRSSLVFETTMVWRPALHGEPQQHFCPRKHKKRCIPMHGTPCSSCCPQVLLQRTTTPTGPPAPLGASQQWRRLHSSTYACRRRHRTVRSTGQLGCSSRGF